METWEMIKEIKRNPYKKFKCIKHIFKNVKINDIGQFVSMIDGVLHWNDDPEDKFLIASAENHEWVEVKRPVSWKEAMRHHLDVINRIKEIKSEYSFIIRVGNVTYKQHKDDKLGCFKSFVGDFTDGAKYIGIDSSFFEIGEWFLGE